MMNGFRVAKLQQIILLQLLCQRLLSTRGCGKWRRGGVDKKKYAQDAAD
jgi:hypothetical protein